MGLLTPPLARRGNRRCAAQRGSPQVPPAPPPTPKTPPPPPPTLPHHPPRCPRRLGRNREKVPRGEARQRDPARGGRRREERQRRVEPAEEAEQLDGKDVGGSVASGAQQRPLRIDEEVPGTRRVPEGRD